MAGRGRGNRNTGRKVGGSGPKPDGDSPLSRLPEEERDKLIRAEIIENPEVLTNPAVLGNPKVQEAMLISIQKSYKGPVPSAEQYAGYESATPGAGRELIEMSKRSLEAQIEFNNRRLSGDFTEAGRGQWMGFVIAMTAILAGTYALIHGAEVGGTIIGGLGLSAVVYQFIQGKRR